ncbi:uncharacterized protein si:ch73-345f18.3 [Synchiropus splendidus]|uniref:uncharacterized protein si:ch73-345f18.3 n=1 Tax=Synchiropus splendidus TaxID=270530 RepID=UPI00237D3C2B|nr:uncharacterized protein si:ch73-345f18.3 [Synchiropus splendidus]
MLAFLCCCCSSRENSLNERQPLLQPVPTDPNAGGIESARRTRVAQADPARSDKLLMRRVCVPELDQRFSDVSDTFNEQQRRYRSMVQHITNLCERFGCDKDRVELSECVETIRLEHQNKHVVSVKMKGYDFFLSVAPVEQEADNEIPPNLQLAEEELRNTSENAKATISKGTVLQELISWLLRSKDQMSKQVKEIAVSYQEQRRLLENLEENMKEVRRAKEMSLKYRQKAGEVLTEAAQLSGSYQ